MTLPRHVFRRLAGDVSQAVETAGGESPSTPAGLTLGRYELISLVGQGSGGVVWRAWDPLLERAAAIKILREPLEAASHLTKSAAGEFAAMAGLEGSGFVQIYDVGRCEVPAAVFGERGDAITSHAFCAMEWIPGGSLAESIEAGPVEAREAAALIATVARGLATAHRAGILHLDIKPSNILIATDGPRLVDFGAMRGLFETDGERARPAGTLGFLAPEQAHGRESEIGPRSDVHGLGATLAALVCGVNLPGDDDLAAVDPELAAIFERAMARDPERRYASAIGLAAALDAYLAPDAHGTGDVARSETRRRRQLGLAAFAGLVALVFLLGKTLTQTEGNPKTEATARYEDVLAEFAERSAPLTTWSLDEHLELLRAQAGALLSRFSFHPADLDLFEALTQRGALAQAIETLVARHQGELANRPLPAEVAVFRRLGAYIDGEVPQRNPLESQYPASRLAHLEAAMEALIEEQPTAAEAALAPLSADDPDRRLAAAALDFQRHGSRCDRDELENLSAKHAFLESDLGLLDLAGEDPRAALVHFEAALESYPELATARHHRIVALERLGRHAEAKAALEAWIRAVDRDPDTDWDRETPSEFTLGSRSSSVYLWPSKERLFGDPWLAGVRP
jgi:serine/threonine protein kinase